MKGIENRIIAVWLGLLVGALAFGAGSEEAAQDGVPTLLWADFAGPVGPPPSGTENQLLLEERFGVKLEVLQTDPNDQAQLTTLLASGTIPDLMSVRSLPLLHFLVDQGAVRPLTPEMLWRHMPDWMEEVARLVDPEIIFTSGSYQGQIWRIPDQRVWDYIPRDAVARKDWLANVGITEVPRTLSDWEAMLRAFTENDPDGNGSDDTVGITTRSANGYIPHVSGAFGIQPRSSTFSVRDGQVFMPQIDDAYRQYLELMASWYENGWLDREFLTDTSGTRSEKFLTGVTGVFNHDVRLTTSYTDQLKESLGIDDPTVQLPPPVGPSGESGTRLHFPSDRFGWAIGANASDEDVELIMRIKNELVADNEWFTRMWYGERGRDYELDEDGLPVRTRSREELQREVGASDYFGFRPLSFEWLQESSTPRYRVMYEAAMSYPTQWTGIGFAYSGVNEAYFDHYGDLDSMYKEFEAKAITGDIDIGSEWPEFVTRVLATGGQEIIEEFQRLYDASN